MSIKEKWNNFITKAHKEGIILIFIKDPKTSEPSVSLTLTIISFLTVIVGIIGKWNGSLQIDIAQALNLFYASAALYFGRKWTSGDNSISSKSEDKS